jgi:hypothetical protein
MKKTHERYWPPELVETLRGIWTDPAPLKTQLHLFPGRTIGGLKAQAQALELPDRRALGRERAEQSSGTRIRAAMEAKPGTLEDLAARAMTSTTTVRNFVKRHRAEVHVKRYAPRAADGFRAAIWAWGVGKDAPWPKTDDKRECANRYYRKMRRDPEWKARNAAKQRLNYAERTGKLVRRDAAAIAMFGEAGGARTE